MACAGSVDFLGCGENKCIDNPLGNSFIWEKNLNEIVDKKIWSNNKTHRQPHVNVQHERQLTRHVTRTSRDTSEEDRRHPSKQEKVEKRKKTARNYFLLKIRCCFASVFVQRWESLLVSAQQAGWPACAAIMPLRLPDKRKVALNFS